MHSTLTDIGFLFIRFVIEKIDKLRLWLIGKRNEACQGTDFSVEVLHILARHKLNFSDEEDFILLHQSFAQARILRSSRWVLSKVTAKYAYFSLLPKGRSIENYQVDTAPFLWLTLFEISEKCARLPIKQFCRFANSCFGLPIGRLLFIHNPPRSGSTLIAKMLQVPQSVVVLSEPEPLGMLGYRRSNGCRQWSDETILDLTRAVISALCKDMHAHQLYVIKNLPHAVKEIGLVRDCFPEAKHLFLFRRNLTANMQSVLRLLIVTEGCLDRALCRTLFPIWPKLLDWLHMPAWYRTEVDFICMIRPNDLLDLCAIVIGSVVYNYQKFYNRGKDMTVFYEDLLGDNARSTIEGILHFCGIEERFVDGALASREKDWQAGTWLSSQSLTRVHNFLHRHLQYVY